MLESLHVKNLALIEETEVEFGPGLNILTGETGAGKSLLIGSVNLALGGKFEKEMLRKGADSALVELVFSADAPGVREFLDQSQLEQTQDGSLTISRRLQAGKSVCRINGEIVTARQVKELAELLIDIHGQHEHQSLLNKKSHLDILDGFCGGELETLAEEAGRLYVQCREGRERLNRETVDETSRRREQSLAEFEWQEIEQAKPVPGEDGELEKQYRLMVNGKRILEGLTESYQSTGGDFPDGASGALSRALRALRGVSGYDERLGQLEEQLSQVDSLLADYNRELSEYMQEREFDGEDFARVEERLNLLNRLKEKYGGTLEDVIRYQEERRAQLEKYEHYDSYLANLQQELAEAEQKFSDVCGRMSKIRRQNAAVLAGQLKEALRQLNFQSVEFEIAVRPEGTRTARGWDDVEFLISTNPGESLKPLSQVASGGELSRVMLAIKTVSAGKDGIGTLIFDEIDAGISGRTAWRVSEQLNRVAENTQVLCITHLPQIAAMADRHFVIEKNSTSDSTITDIRPVDADESTGELARLLGSDAATDAAWSNAQEMRAQALAYKKNRHVNLRN